MVVLARAERDVHEFLKISFMILSYMVDVKVNMILGGVVGGKHDCFFSCKQNSKIIIVRTLLRHFAAK